MSKGKWLFLKSERGSERDILLGYIKGKGIE